MVSGLGRLVDRCVGGLGARVYLLLHNRIELTVLHGLADGPARAEAFGDVVCSVENRVHRV